MSGCDNTSNSAWPPRIKYPWKYHFWLPTFPSDFSQTQISWQASSTLAFPISSPPPLPSEITLEHHSRPPFIPAYPPSIPADPPASQYVPRLHYQPRTSGAGRLCHHRYHYFIISFIISLLISSLCVLFLRSHSSGESKQPEGPRGSDPPPSDLK